MHEKGEQSMKQILLIAGTVEGRQLAAAWAQAGHQVWASVATAYGAELLTEPGVTVLQGRRDSAQLQELLQQLHPDYLVDASHPFAQAVSENALAACRATGTPYIRLERPQQPLVHKQVRYVDSWQEAATLAATLAAADGGSILLTTGSNNLDVFVQRVADFAQRLFVRVLPTAEVLAKCEALGLSAHNIFAAQGPFSVELNVALLRHCGASVLVSKDSGKAGGLPEKLEACIQEEAMLVLLRRPQLSYPLQFSQATDLMQYLEREPWNHT